MTLPIFCVDAFTTTPFTGNPAGVVIMDQEEPESWMRDVAGEMNLAETAFAVKRSAGEYGLRWFTPTVEVDMCGHATLATAFVLWEEGLEPGGRIVFHTKSGPLPAARAGNAIALDFPAIGMAPAPAPAGMLEAMGLPAGLPAQLGGKFYLIELESEEAVRALSPDFALLKKVDAFGVIATAKGGAPGVDFVSRFFAPAAGIDEDPVTGSSHCRLAPYWSRRLGKQSFFAVQASRRGGQLHVRLAGGRVILQGNAALAWKGSIAKPV